MRLSSFGMFQLHLCSEIAMPSSDYAKLQATDVLYQLISSVSTRMFGELTDVSSPLKFLNTGKVFPKGSSERCVMIL